MKIESMKLLDLQTGKYLELRKDWLYGGKYIYVFYKRGEGCDDERDGNGYYKDEPQEPLKTLCEKTGAVVYGGRYVLLEFKEYCDEELRKIVDIVTDGLVVCDDVLEEKVEDLKNAINKQYNIMIIFEEYSKQLRNEPNKFDELNELLK